VTLPYRGAIGRYPVTNAAYARFVEAGSYQERHLMECFINTIKHYRRIFSRFEKLAGRYLAFLHFVRMLIWLR
jgi:transposase